MSLISDREVQYLRRQFEETVRQLGVAFKYQYPLGNDIDEFAQPAPDGYSTEREVFGIFDGEPKLKTYISVSAESRESAEKIETEIRRSAETCLK